MRSPTSRPRLPQPALGALALAAALAGCDASEMLPAAAVEPPAAPSADDEVDLDSMLGIAGAADIRHGTGEYRAPASAPKDEREGRIFVAFLSGGQEVPAVRSKAEGALALILDGKQDKLRFVLSHQVQDASAIHLHIGSAGENGPVAVALPETKNVSAGTLRITAAQAKELLAGRVYINVHSKAHPMGEIRGQVLRPGETVFVAALRGSDEIPAVRSSATAQASLILSAARDQIRYRVAFTGLAPTAAHVHRGIAGENGPVAFPLAAGANGLIEGSFPVRPTDVQELALRSFYLNLHSAAHPMGELRGQVVRPGEVVLTSKLSGAEEVPAVSSDKTGTAMLVLGSAGAKLLYVLKTDAPATVAHIHRAPGGSNGPVELPLEPVGPVMSGILDLGDARRADVERGLWYVNVHTAANPKGELRGQVLRPGETLYTAILAGSNEVPANPTPSMATGAVGFILDAAGTGLRYDGSVTGTTPTALHIHDAPAGSNGPVVFPLAFTGSAIAGELTLTAEQLSKLDAAGFYVNVHSAAAPAGEIRGQIVRPGAKPPAPAPAPPASPPPAHGPAGHGH